jgi:hypothetical protein
VAAVAPRPARDDRAELDVAVIIQAVDRRGERRAGGFVVRAGPSALFIALFAVE